jgi:hypothetical protein
MKRAAIVVAAVCALPLAAAAQVSAMPRMFQGMEKGQWKVDILEHSQARGQQMPSMTMCTDSLMKQAKEHPGAAKGERQCKQRMVKDGSDEAVMEIACPERTVTTTMKRESPKSVLADIKSTGKDPMNMKMRYTYVGACREGQAAFGMDKNSEQCKKIQASVAKMDPAKDCAGSGAQRAQCEQTVRQHIAQAKAMCN